MTAYIDRADLKVAEPLAQFIEDQALPGTGVATADFWAGFSALVHDLGPRNRALLQLRADMQKQIDDWHIAHRSRPHDAAAYQAFLEEIGYLVPEGPDFEIETRNVDPEIATIPGAQLVVPIMNARFALNAANARWGNLYDALYGTDALGDLPSAGGYDASRGARVIAWAKRFLDGAVPLQGASWSDVDHAGLDGTALILRAGARTVTLKDPAQFAGSAAADDVQRILFRNNGLGIEVVINRDDQIGATDPAGIAAVNLESALSTIMDCEDSVAAVDAEDKVLAYANWLGLMTGELQETFEKGGKTITRRMHGDRTYVAPDGTPLSVKGRSLMLVRNVGHLMTNPAIHDRDGNEVGEGLMDAMITTLIAMHDLKKQDGLRNSVCGSVYVVKPKMHGPEEVAFANDIFGRVEKVLGLPEYTVKLGIMDEERRTSVNLKECIRAAKHRVAFINTGFLDRTGDEIHTSMEAGPMIPKGEMKGAAWIGAYEDRNVDIGLACGLKGR
ncbi:MAG: malate synthase G, partial [Pseudomonadota bacterium]